MNTLLCGEHLVLPNKPWTALPCVCKRQSSSYNPSAVAGYAQFVEKILLHFGFIKNEDIQPVSVRWHSTQQQLKSKTGARDFVRKGKQVETLAVSESTSQESNVESAPLANSDSPPAKSELTHMISQSTSTEDLAEKCYPTDAHVRAKKLREQREKGKTEVQIKDTRKRKPKEHDAHFDDCGSDMEILEDHHAVAALAVQNVCGAVLRAHEC